MVSSSQIILNQTNHKLEGGKSVLEYPLPVDNQSSKSRYEIGVESLFIYNSFFNVSSEFQNNSITIRWLGVDYIFTLPDGYYSVEDLNLFLQQQMFVNNLYLTDGMTVPPEYFIEIKVNRVRYGVEVNLYNIPTTLPTGFTLPAGATWSLPVTAETPQIYLSSTFGKLIGFSGNQYYPSSPENNSISFNNDLPPAIHTISSVIVTCNLISNDKFLGGGSRNDVLITFPINNEFGEQIIRNNNTIIFSNVSKSQQQNLQLRFYDQNLRQLTILDTDLVINLVIKEKEESIADLLTSLLQKSNSQSQIKGGSFR